ncbi:MAG: hypothetical protein ACI3YD_03935, partial [Alloprevotella sp.]
PPKPVGKPRSSPCAKVPQIQISAPHRRKVGARFNGAGPVLKNAPRLVGFIAEEPMYHFAYLPFVSLFNCFFAASA